MSPDQKHTIEALLGHPIADTERVILETIPQSPEWLQNIQREAREKGLDRLTMGQIDQEIAATRRQRRERIQLSE